MNDIIEMLRYYRMECGDFPALDVLTGEAADEIEKLRGREKILIQELEEVSEERDAAVKDAERYRWLRNTDHMKWDGGYTNNSQIRGIRLSGPYKGDMPSDSWICGAELDAAIDAARKEET